MKNYSQFLEAKSQLGGRHGFEPIWMPDFLFDFQKKLHEWNCQQGRCADFADCGLGKTPLLLSWAENVVIKTNKRVLVVTPLAVSDQTIREAKKFDIEAYRSRDGKPKKNITVTNYEQLHKFDPGDYVGVACDESSAIKNFEGERQKVVTEFMRKMAYRSLFTATAAPNDYIELGTSAEALGELGRMDMLGMFFKNDENSMHPIWWGARWRFKKHAERQFWRWVCSWARAIRKPSDMGFKDGKFKLPPLNITETVISNERPFDGNLFTMPAVTIHEQRNERKLTIKERCEAVARKIEDHDCSVAWCHLNAEGDLLEKLIPGAMQVKGDGMSDEEKEEIFRAFSSGECKRLVIKPVIGAFGLNWQHCAHATYFPSHSFEQWYQSVRRFWRFGQKRPVTVDIVTSEGEAGVMRNLQRKAEAASRMFDQLIEEMNNALRPEQKEKNSIKIKTPSWL